MPYLTEQKVTRVTLPSNKEYWVDIINELRWKEAKQFATINDDGDVTYALDKLLLTLIKDWNLDGVDGTRLEISQENIDQLNRQDAEALIGVVGGVVAEETTDAKKVS